jgi:oxygen-independent coproporphyrinogen-3 oxidase
VAAARAGVPSSGVARDRGGRVYDALQMNEIQHGVRFDRDLVRKYDRPGPRYTSYPTAPQFRSDFGPERYAELLADSRRRPLPLSLYIHVPFCTRRCFYCGCNVVIARDRERGRRYVDLLAVEMEMAAELLGAERREVVQLHWGGGTPTFLASDDLAALMAATRSTFNLAPDCEVSVEVDPRQASPEQLAVLAAAGFNRMSLGVQDLDPRVQQAVGRVQPEELVWEVLARARALGIRGINVDLIYGLPHQTPASFAATLEKVVRMAPDRLALFNFAYLPGLFPHQKALAAEALPDAETKLAILERSVEDLTGAGYLFIGMDHFARPDDSLARALRQGSMTRNFQGYSTHAETDLVGLGVSSIGKVAGGYAQNAKELPDYRAAIENGRLATRRGLELSADDTLRRDVIMALMCQFRLAKPPIERQHAIVFDDYFADALEELRPLADDGLVELHPDRLEVTAPGRLMVRNVAMAFDAYLRADSSVRYSRTV